MYMENEGSLNATTAMMRDKNTNRAWAVKEEMKIERDSLGESEREKRVVALQVSLDYRIKVLPLLY
jgi:hypothetical protein